MYSQNKLNSVVRYYLTERLEHTKIVDHQVSENLPDNAKVLHLLGGIAFQAERFDMAIKFIEKAIEADPTKEEFYHDLGAAYHGIGDLDKAISIFKHALFINPANYEVNKNLGLTLYLKGELDGAVEAFHRAFSINLNDSEFNFTRGNLFKTNGKLDRAVAGYQHEAALNSSGDEIYLKLGNTFNELGKTREAIFVLKNAVFKQPNSFEAHFNLGNALTKQGYLDEAIKSYRHAIAIRPNYAEAYHNLGATFFEQDRVKDAINAYQSAVDLDPTNFSAKYLLNALTIKTAERAPAQYIKKLFDQYSNIYEEHMARELDYRVPGLLRKVLQPLINNGHIFKYALDLGCGTGLAGVEIRFFSKWLVGLDLSSKMIAKARKKDLYDKLILGEITEYLNETDERFNLIVAADVLNYFGNLKPVFNAIKNRLSNGAYFLFTTEKTIGKDYALCKTGRFAHTKPYILKLAKTYRFVLKGFKSEKIRKEKEEWTDGDVYLLKSV